MSKENHPNIQAVALTVDIFKSIGKHLRGQGRQYAGAMINKKFKELIEFFVVDVSTEIDREVSRQEGIVLLHVQPGYYQEGMDYIDNNGKIFRLIQEKK